MIKLITVNKYFHKGDEREVHALNNINLNIKSGEFGVITGPSGCGKSTLLNAMGCLDDIDNGDIYLDGNLVSGLSEENRTHVRLKKIGFVFQSYNLIPVFNVEENIAFIMKLRGVSKEIINKRVNELASILEIKDKLKAMPNHLSGGQQQRVAVARAVASKPILVLADEPTANLDSKNSIHLMKLMKNLNEKEGITIIFASHDDYVVELSKRRIRMEDGKIIN
jgi:putative ABC transport system ATP-binding protein